MNENQRLITMRIAKLDREIRELRLFPSIQDRKRAQREVLVELYKKNGEE
jgi:hypothetical protein